MQSKESKGIVDGSVTILDHRSPEAVKPCLGLQGDFEKIDKKTSLYNNVHCFMKAKDARRIGNKNTSWTTLLGELKRYHAKSKSNENAFSIAIRGFEIGFLWIYMTGNTVQGIIIKGQIEMALFVYI